MRCFIIDLVANDLMFSRSAAFLLSSSSLSSSLDAILVTHVVWPPRRQGINEFPNVGFMLIHAGRFQLVKPWINLFQRTSTGRFDSRHRESTSTHVWAPKANHLGPRPRGARVSVRAPYTTCDSKRPVILLACCLFCLQYRRGSQKRDIRHPPAGDRGIFPPPCSPICASHLRTAVGMLPGGQSFGLAAYCVLSPHGEGRNSSWPTTATAGTAQRMSQQQGS
ncbi:hypothetical protein LY76DRAFT_385830 [Colletotrichum caudatum]|nr:hypothetical protein LY76DRAFT_385830 [Colletotrichum caudatum]